MDLEFACRKVNMLTSYDTLVQVILDEIKGALASPRGKVTD